VFTVPKLACCVSAVLLRVCLRWQYVQPVPGGAWLDTGSKKAFGFFDAIAGKDGLVCQPLCRWRLVVWRNDACWRTNPCRGRKTEGEQGATLGGRGVGVRGIL